MNACWDWIFLELHGRMVDLGDSVLHISGEKKTGSWNLVQTKTYRPVLDSTVSLPPHSEYIH